jgi:UDP-2,3-diacylglucosamine hydrolase
MAPELNVAPKLGIIAGGGALPGLLGLACKATGRSHYILGLTGFADSPALQADDWIRVGEIGKAFAALNAAFVKEVVLAGTVRRPAIAETDLKGAAFLARIAGRALGDDGLLSALIGEIEREGFKVVGADSILHHLLAPVGVLGRHCPDETALSDVARGFDVALMLGAADVGQAVVVQNGIVLGVEAAEGTDALIARCAALSLEGLGGVLVKAKKPQQERRADLPTVGVNTVRNAKAVCLRGIAVEAGHTLMINLPEIIAAADDAGLFVVGVVPAKPRV